MSYVVLKKDLFDKMVEYMSTQKYTEVAGFFEVLKGGGAISLEEEDLEKLKELKEEDEESPE